MKLSKRLKAICDLIPSNSKIIDVGADHALVDIYLTKYKNCTCLATDISENAIQNAIQNSIKYKTTIQTKVTDGLNNLNLTNQIIIISGMGAYTIMDILNKNITNDIVISSHTNIPEVRGFMQNKNYHIHKEIAIKEKHYYIITYYKYGKSKKTNNIISPFLINNTDYMNHLLSYYQMKYEKETKPLNKLKYKYLTIKIRKHIK